MVKLRFLLTALCFNCGESLPLLAIRNNIDAISSARSTAAAYITHRLINRRIDISSLFLMNERRKGRCSFDSSSNIGLRMLSPEINDSENLTETTEDTFDVVFLRDEDTPDGLMEEIQSTRPPEWMIMRELLGINIFTLILIAAITFFASMNLLLGPGWLGSRTGIQGTGMSAFEPVGATRVVDLSDSAYQP